MPITESRHLYLWSWWEMCLKYPVPSRMWLMRAQKSRTLSKHPKKVCPSSLFAGCGLSFSWCVLDGWNKVFKDEVDEVISNGAAMSYHFLTVDNRSLCHQLQTSLHAHLHPIYPSAIISWYQHLQEERVLCWPTRRNLSWYNSTMRENIQH